MRRPRPFRQPGKLSPKRLHQRMSRWYASPARAKTLNELQHLLARWLNDRFGYYALNLSSFSSPLDCLAAARTQYRFNLGPCGPDTVLHFDALPIDTESVDLIVALHVLEFADDPHLVLREFDRILIPNGCLIVIGFNPYARLSLLKSLRLRRDAPWCGRFYSSWRLQEWFSVLGFSVKEVCSCALPGIDRRHQRPPEPWRKWLPCLGDLVALKTCKLVSRLTPLPRGEDERRLSLKNVLQQPTAFDARPPKRTDSEDGVMPTRIINATHPRRADR